VIRLTYCKIKQVFEEITMHCIKIFENIVLQCSSYCSSDSRNAWLLKEYARVILSKHMKVKKQWIFFKLYSPVFIYKLMKWGFKIVVILHFKIIKITQNTKTMSIMPILNKTFLFSWYTSTFSSTFVSVEFHHTNNVYPCLMADR